MKVCVVGSGGREHALALALARTAEVVVTPGNPGMAGTSEEGYPISLTEIPPEAIRADLFVIGPEQPLVDGLADKLRDEVRPAHEFLRELPGPWVVKTDGLASGKGVLVTDDISEAEADIVAKLSGESFGEAGRRVVVEEGLVGAECSLLVVCDGRRIAPLPVAQDYKRLEDGDLGPNTGGMGAVSGVGLVADGLVDRILDESVEPLVAALRRRGIDYRGVLYAGLILTDEGPKVLEYNVRFGDPETQVVLPRVDEDVTGLLAEAAAGRLRSDPRSRSDAVVCVVLASAGYPTDPRSGDPIEGLDAAGVLPGVTVLHAGTRLDEQGRLVTAGGRVLGVTGTARTMAGARDRAYAGVGCIGWEGMQYRRDIAAHIAEAEGPLTDGVAGRGRGAEEAQP